MGIYGDNIPRYKDEWVAGICRGHNVTMTIIPPRPHPPELVLQFGLMKGGGVSITNDGGGGGGR